MMQRKGVRLDKACVRLFMPIVVFAFLSMMLVQVSMVAAQGNVPTNPTNRYEAIVEPTNAMTMTVLGRYDSGIEGESASEIVAYDSQSQRLFITNAFSSTIDVLDATDPTRPVLTSQIVISPTYGKGANSVAVANGVLAAAVEHPDSVSAGSVVFFDTDGQHLSTVEAGVLPDMLTFTPDGQKVLVANEGEPDDSDPEGSVTIVDLSAGAANVSQSDVMSVNFSALNGQENALRARGVRIFPDKTVAEDVEPEYLSVSPDGSTAFVTLQENNAFGVINIETAELIDILPLGLKDHRRGPATLDTFEFPQLPLLGTTEGGQDILLGGLSGLWFEGMDNDGNYQFVTVPDRGPNGAPTDVDNDGQNERPFALPDYQARIVRFTLNSTSGQITLGDTILLKRADGTTPITGLPNIAGADEEPVDLSGNLLSYDAFGADLEGVVVASDGTFWMVDEYRPSIYHFDTNGVLIERLVPEGTGTLAGQPAGTYGTESLPAEYINRRANRGFEAIAFDTDNNILYAFIQTPLMNPDRATSDASRVIRMVGIDPDTSDVVAEYAYLLEAPSHRTSIVDKVSGAVYAGNDTFYVIERDSATSATGKKYIYEINLKGATNLKATYLKATADHVEILPYMTVGDIVPRTSNANESYRMVGVPDGLGAYTDEDRQVHLFVNHEFDTAKSSAPIVDGEVITGAFVSEYVLENGQPKVISGDLAFNEVLAWTGSGFQDYTTEWKSGQNVFGRFCSGYLAGPNDGFSDQIYLTGEESGNQYSAFTFSGLGGQSVAVVDGKAHVLPEMGHFAKENVVVLPNTGNNTVVLLLEDGPKTLDSQLYMYVGSKDANASTAVERAGLVGGDLYFFRSTTAGEADDNDFHKGDGTINGEWVLIDESSGVLQAGETVESMDDDTLNERVKAAGAFNFIRLEDGEADHNLPGVFYFDTTGSTAQNDNNEYINKLGRLYKLSIDVNDPINGTSSLQVLLEGDAGDPIVNPDNLAINRFGQMLIQEDPNTEHRGDGLLDSLGRDASVWLYDVPGDNLGTDGTLVRVAEIEQRAVLEGMRREAGYWESSGAIDAEAIYGPGTWLLDVQAHSLKKIVASLVQGYETDQQLVEGGQLLLLDTSRVESFAVNEHQTDDGSYLKPVAANVQVLPYLTVGETVKRTSNNSQSYRMVGIPDGQGAYVDDNDAVHLFVNHEFGTDKASVPIVDGDVISGAIVSEYILTKGTPQVVSGDLAFNTVQEWTGSGFQDQTADWLAGNNSFGRFCSGYLAGPADGFNERIYLTGEESGNQYSAFTFSGLGGQSVAVVNNTAYILPEMGHFAKENVVVLPNTGNNTVIFALEDGPKTLDSQLYMYMGSKNANAATAIEREGLVGGDLYVFGSTTAGEADENDFHKGDGAINGTWILIDQSSGVLQAGETVETIDDDTLNERVKAAGAFNFIRLEDGAADLNQPGVFYFDTTGSTAQNDNNQNINKLGRLYRLQVDVNDPTNGSTTLEVLLEGDAGDDILNPDNLEVNKSGQMLIQEDPNREHRGAGLLDSLERDASVWLYDLPDDNLGNDGTLVRVAEVNQMAVPEEMREVRGYWESSGAIATDDIYGPNTWLLNVQAHSVMTVSASILQGSETDLDLVEGGQLLLLDTSQVGVKTLEQHTPDELAAQHIHGVNKIKVTNLPSLGYLAGDKPEGLALLNDGRLAVLNDNDFALLDNPIPGDGTIELNPDPTPVTLGIISFAEGNALDASNLDGLARSFDRFDDITYRDNPSGTINIQNWPVYGMYQPDSIASFEANGQTYYATANEGDARDEDMKAYTLTLDLATFPNTATLQSDAQIGRLNISSIDGDIDRDGDYDQLWAYGGRSFTIWDEYGNLVFDSSDEFERITAQQVPEIFNSNGMTDTFDTRSDDKGPEPEALTIGQIDGKTYAFIGLERIGGIMVYDVTNPSQSTFVTYVREPMADQGPEGLQFVSSSDSPTGKSLLIVASEVSGSTTLYELNVAESDPTAINLAELGIKQATGYGYGWPIALGMLMITLGLMVITRRR